MSDYNTAGRIIRQAGEDAGRIMEGSQPSSTQYLSWMNRLQDLIGHLQTKGLKLWTWADTAITLAQGQQTYSFGPTTTKPLRVLGGYYLLSDGVTQRPLTPISWTDWELLPNKGVQGSTCEYFIDKQQFQLNVNFWPVPDALTASGTAHLLVESQVSGPLLLTDSTGFPNEWYRTLRWGVANELSVGQPKSIQDKAKMEYEAALKDLEGWDVEDVPMKFEVATPMFPASRFR